MTIDPIILWVIVVIWGVNTLSNVLLDWRDSGGDWEDPVERKSRERMQSKWWFPADRRDPP